jgi:hypothetical protein
MIIENPLKEDTVSKLTKSIQILIDRTLTTQDLCRKHNVTAMTINAWRRRGLPCIVIKGDRRPSIRFVKTESADWIKNYLSSKKEK